MHTPLPPRMDRRLAIKWMMAAGGAALLARPRLLAGTTSAAAPGGKGYGTDPDLVKPYKPGDFWPLTLTDAQRRDTAALCDIIVPAEGANPSASAVGVTDFIDEWVSAPYPDPMKDRPVILDGLAWLATEAPKRYGAAFADLTAAQRLELAEVMAASAEEGSELHVASHFFRKFRDLTSSGYFSTPPGMRDLGYVGNVPSANFDGPPADLVARLGLTEDVKW